MTHEEGLAKLEAKRQSALAGGQGKVRDKHIEAGKLLVRQRLEILFDDGFDFEDGLLAGSERDLPGDGIVTVIGKVNGRDVAVVANDMTVKAGTWGPQALLKFNRMQELALETGIPLLYLVDSAGARIDQQKELFLGRNGWGNIWYNQVQISGRVPQVCVLFGPSPAGAAYVPGLCDLVIMVDKQASAYLGSPRMAKMTIFEDVTEEQMGGARLHCMFSGLGDVLVKNDAEGIEKAKQFLSYLPLNWTENAPSAQATEPNAEAVGKIDTVVPINQNVPYDVHQLIDGLIDEGSFFEVKELYAKEMTVGMARLGGQPVGIVANNSKHKGGVIFSDTSDKAARFIWLCNAYNVPLLFLQDVSGYMIGSSVEKSGIIRHGAKLLSAVCESSVPRICVLVRKAYGGGYLAMSGAPTHPDAMLALPTALPALVGPEAAVNAIHYNRIMELPEEERADFVKQKRDEFAKDIDVYRAAADSFAAEDVLPASRLRDDLIKRFRIYSRRDAKVINRRSAVHPV
ncbi:acyl-CoA carboxylase subunit beta [Chelatococcus asaccharovorans]|uniref:Acetyl-CoA carboxylase carboxyltransferase component n=1 Tax=Chelatococcus asaccharovorans TaxID=28210 RepID=A0A2V3U225_9HYPH|nr:acyl-CoA carboxylase subunit beta [Chelatococcus asaccharovorans]MBS7707854.1 acyl-CoA carboxylase subunit beta [Chelatococcus asaccharovorans]PXW50899.1 acetyl-CoA carboxylase carboxyltransferase component [Chelatococcus asaccharovorans]